LLSYRMMSAIISSFQRGDAQQEESAGQ